MNSESTPISCRNTAPGVVKGMDLDGLLLSDFAEIRSSFVETPFSVDRYSVVANCRVGRYSSFGTHSFASQTSIGRFVSIGSRSSIGPNEHSLHGLTTSLFVEDDSRMYAMGRASQRTEGKFPRRYPTVIEHDCWVGDNVVVLQGVSLAIGSVVGAGSVVTRNTLPYEIVAGNPARRLRFRFDDQTIDRLLATHWWNRPESQLSDLVGMPLETTLSSLEGEITG